VPKAYRELDHEGLVVGRRDQGKFVSQALTRAAPIDHSARQAEHQLSVVAPLAMDSTVSSDLLVQTNQGGMP
jgi:DNA-binding transcriptional regulator YhcF (GntR family)